MTIEVERNQILFKQNSEPLMKLLRARSQIYRWAVGFQIAQFVATVIFPLGGAATNFVEPQWRGNIAAAVVLLTTLDVLWLDRAMKRNIKFAAKVSEQFDCELFNIGWNLFVAGPLVQPGLVNRAAKAWRGGDEKLRNWYAAAVGEVESREACLVCQRLNLGYDSGLRRAYGRSLLVALAAITFGMVVGAYSLGLPWDGSLTTLLIPLAPLALWAIREFFRQKDAGDAVDLVRGQADAFFERLYAKTAMADDHRLRAREFQDAIFLRRTQNPLISPFLYRLMRKRMEAGMNDDADEIIRRLKN